MLLVRPAPKMVNLSHLFRYFQYFQSSEGNVAVVEFLMKQGAGIHMRDRNNDTPLLCAIKSGHNGFKLFLEEYFNFQMIFISPYIFTLHSMISKLALLKLQRMPS